MIAAKDPGKVKTIGINLQGRNVTFVYNGKVKSNESIAQPTTGTNIIESPIAKLHQAITTDRFLRVLNSPKYG